MTTKNTETENKETEIKINRGFEFAQKLTDEYNSTGHAFVKILTGEYKFCIAEVDNMDTTSFHQMAKAVMFFVKMDEELKIDTTVKLVKGTFHASNKLTDVAILPYSEVERFETDRDFLEHNSLHYSTNKLEAIREKNGSQFVKQEDIEEDSSPYKFTRTKSIIKEKPHNTEEQEIETVEEASKNEASKLTIKDFIYHKGYQRCTKTVDGVEETFSFTKRELKERIIHSGNRTVCILDDGSKGVAKCDKEDNYDETKGIKIAYTRAKIKSLEKQLKELTK